MNTGFFKPPGATAYSPCPETGGYDGDRTGTLDSCPVIFLLVPNLTACQPMHKDEDLSSPYLNDIALAASDFFFRASRKSFLLLPARTSLAWPSHYAAVGRMAAASRPDGQTLPQATGFGQASPSPGRTSCGFAAGQAAGRAARFAVSSQNRR